MLCADASLSTFDLIGPYGLSHYLATMRSYTYRHVSAVILFEPHLDTYHPFVGRR